MTAPALDLRDLIVAHRVAVEDFRRAMRSGGGGAQEDRAFAEEALAMLALLSFPPSTIEEARGRAAYLATTRFPDGLDAEGRAYLFSMVSCND